MEDDDEWVTEVDPALQFLRLFSGDGGDDYSDGLA